MTISYLKSAIAGALTLGLGTMAVPSFAAPAGWDRLDSITVSHRDREHTVDLHFAGDLHRIAFRARDADVRCNTIRISFDNDTNQFVDGRRYGKDHLVRIDLHGGHRHVAHIHFDCRPLGRNRARLIIYGQ